MDNEQLKQTILRIKSDIVSILKEEMIDPCIRSGMENLKVNADILCIELGLDIQEDSR